MHMNIYVFFSKFEHLIYFCQPVFLSGFFLVLIRFTFLGLTGSVTYPVLITLIPPNSNL
jgi:hypothetical protein